MKLLASVKRTEKNSKRDLPKEQLLDYPTRILSLSHTESWVLRMPQCNWLDINSWETSYPSLLPPHARPLTLSQPSSPILLLLTFSAPQWASLSWLLMFFHTAWHYILIPLPVFDTCFYFWVKMLSKRSVLHHLNLPPDLHQVAQEMGWDN